MDRRRFLRTGATALGTVVAASHARGQGTVDASRLPRWRGFNLLEKFTDQQNAPFSEWDFDRIAEWGFDFVRLPMSYWCWSQPDPSRWLDMDEGVLGQIDDAVAMGRSRGIHVNLNLHRAPGYCVNPPSEPLDIWTDEQALEAAASHWGRFAQRYRGIPSTELSFDLLNEPAVIPLEQYLSVHRRLIAAIRDEDADRLIVADGLRWGREPVPELVSDGVAQSTRGYDPMRISHHRASWIDGSDQWPTPTWPLDEGDARWDRDRLHQECIVPWQRLEALGSGVHVGEWGCFNRTPHDVALRWMEDWLQLWREAGWGWALWNLRGSFGILDSGREDVVYESLDGHQLDRRMLELLLSY